MSPPVAPTVEDRPGPWGRGVELDWTVSGLVMYRFQLPEIGEDALKDGAYALQTIASAPVPRAIYLHTGIEAPGALAVAVAPVLAKTIGVEDDDLLMAWSRWYGADVAAHRRNLDGSAPPTHLTPEELVEGM